MEKIRVLLLSGANNHDWKRSSPYFRDMLEDSGRFTVTLAGDASAALEAGPLGDSFDLLFDDYNGPDWSDLARRNFEEAVRGGVGLVILHAANNAFTGWAEFEKMAGLLWREEATHGRFGPIEVKIVDQPHAVTTGVPDFVTPDELYCRLSNPQGAALSVLAEAFSNPETGGSGKVEPVMLALQYGAGRVFHDILGHVWEGSDMSALENQWFRRTLLRGCEWAATGAVTP